MYHINKEITGSGENIALKNTARHYFKNFNILGNSVQEGTPSIDSEAPIESVGDNIQLFDKGTIKSKYILNGDGTITTSSFNTFATDYIEVEGNEDYAISGMPTLTSEYPLGGSTGNWRLAFYDINKNFISLISKSNINEATFLIPTNCKYVVFGNNSQFSSLDILNSFINNNQIKLSKGTSTGPWSPYGQGSIEIYNGNKNWLPVLNKTTITQNGITIKPNGDGTYTANGTSTGAVTYRITTVEGVNSYLHRLPAGKYKGVCENTAYTTHFMQIALNDDILGEKWYNSSPKISFETNGGTYQALIYIRSGVTLNNFVFKPMIILETEENLDYVEHQSQTKALYTQQPFRAIGDVKDRFVKQNGVWHEEHSIYEEILNGTEEWKITTAYDGYYRYMAKLTNCYGQNNSVVGMNTHFTQRINQGHGGYEYLYIQGTEDRGNVYIQVKDITTLDDFKTWLSENNVEVIYQLATPKLIECTPEQVEQLEYFEKEAYSYDETTNIYSTNEVSPYFEVTAYQRISEEFKTRLKEGKITRGYLKVLATDTLPEIIIDENNYLKDLKIEELRYVPEEGFIGGAVAKRVSGNFNNVDNSFDIQDREAEVYLGVELEDETTEYIKYGTYIVQRPEDDQVTDNTSFEALDYMVKFNQEYKDRITYPCTLKQLLDDIIDQAGVNSKVATFANSDFVIENNQFEQGSTLRDVLKAITQVAFNWSRIDADDNLVMDFETREETDEELGTDDYFSFKKSDDYGPVNVIVLRNSQIEGENVTIKDENLINSPKGYNILNTSGFIKNNLLNVEVTRNEDGSFTINGTTDANSGDIRIIYEKPLIIPAGDCTFTYGINGLNMFNNEVNLSSLGKGTYMAIRRMAVSSSKTALTFKNDFEIYNYNIHLNPNTTFNNLTIKPMIYKGHDEKQFQPYIPIGEIEYVISDNPFAYTELKRKQLIEAGRRLFGLRYTPMAVDMLGLMYLNAKDRISVENLNGEKFNTYLLDHTIDYTGIVLDSMQSQAKTKTETKYQYISSLAQGLSHVEIKVDKANKRIESIIESQEDVSEKVAKTVARIEVVYALSDSPAEAPTDGWSTTAPEWVEGKYMWQKTITTYANGSTAETAATNISGAQGKDGVSGNNSYSYVAFANSADGSKDFSRTDSTNKTYIGTLTINESVNENLLRNTNKGTTNWGFQTQNGVVSKEQYTEEGKNAVKLICTTASTGWQYASYSIETEILKRLKENSNYILSFDIKTNIGPSTLEVAIKRGDSTNAIAQGVKADILGDETWEHFSVQLKTISDFSQIIIGGQIIHLNGINKVGYYIIENLKLEEGYRETSYSKSPEDLANDYTQYYWQYTKGEEGVGVKSIIDQYYSSTSNTEVTGGEWKETQDTLQTDRFIWTRSKITWTNGSVTYTDPILAATFNNINSNIIVFKEFTTTQIIENGKIIDRVQETTKRLNNDYSTTEQVDSKVDKVKEDVAILAQKFVDVERTAEEYVIKINEIDNNGVDKIKTRMGYTFNDEGLKIDRPGADTSTIIDEAKIKVTDKTGSEPKSLLYAGYVKEGDTEFSDYEGQTIVATSNLIVQNFLIIGSNSRFQDYYNETLDGNGTGAFDI